MLWGVVTKVLLGVGNPQFHQLGPPKQVHLTNRAHVSRFFPVFFPKLADPSFIYIYQVIKALTITLGRSSDKRAAFQKAQLCIKPCKPNLHASDCGTGGKTAKLSTHARNRVVFPTLYHARLVQVVRLEGPKMPFTEVENFGNVVMHNCTTAPI